MCHFRTLSTSPLSEFSKDRFEFTTPLKRLRLPLFGEQKFASGAALIPK